VDGLNAVLVIESAGVVALLTVSVNVFEAVFCGLLLSRTVTLTLNVPATVGVPKGAPVEELIDIPLGNPVADQL
jgi:hypothetical protein